MTPTRYQLKLVGPIAATGLVMFALCLLLAALLFRQQRGLSAALGENVESRRAAANLEEEGLLALIAVLRQGQVPLAPLHERVQGHLADIQSKADKDRERALGTKLEDSFHRYLDIWAVAEKAGGDERKEAIRKALSLLERET